MTARFQAILPALFLFTLLAAPAWSQTPAAALRAPVIPLPAAAGARVDVAADLPVVFHNEAPATTRVIFGRRDVDGLDCHAGDGVTRSRPGQYTVAAGSELRCTLEEGRYRYETLTPKNGAIERTKAQVTAD